MAIDGPRASEALEQERRPLEDSGEPSVSAARRILEARARLLAQPLAETAVSGDSLDLLVFSRAGERYGVEAASVAEVVLLAVPTPVPWVPPAVLGVVNHRGRIIPVVDVARLLPSPAGEAGASDYAVVLVVGDARFAVRADAITGIAQIERREVRPVADVGADTRTSLVLGVTPAMVAVLDVEALARDPRVEVDDEIE